MASKKPVPVRDRDYVEVFDDVAALLVASRTAAARTVNTLMTSTYWLVGRRIFEGEQKGRGRADYGEQLVERLSVDLTRQFGRGFGRRNLFLMRSFFVEHREIVQAVPAQLDVAGIVQALPAQSGLVARLAEAFPLPWTHYVRLLAVRSPVARRFYAVEALRGGWSSRQLDRQIQSQFYERTALSRNKARMLSKGQVAEPSDAVSAEEAIKDPFVLEFLGLKDEYSELELEEALIKQLETFLLELGGAFTFVGRQRRLRVGDEWYRVDLVFFHRELRCLVVIDLKIGKFTHADAGQMHLYLNYAREHWMVAGENPPVGLILCAEKDHAVAKYALEGLPNKVMAAEYRTRLPDEATLVEAVEKTQRALNSATKKRS
ncbi:MAG: PDDEXK nuclease domain-containing protein [Archangium sp.]|nr:PDDEXK nuclease domain-containing protein [Archangium sp.]MDP3154953.1 PDDEXK nuclease domain-containing protein [Archangium sp.]MDP3576072.1 PDDEXK nuclease domain-containing protein [Archangium sp.]